MDDTTEHLIALTAVIVAAHVGNNEVAVADLPALIRAVHGALAGTATPPPETPREPAVPIRQSVRPEHIVCLEDGAKLRMLKRYLRTRYDLSPDAYRAKWGLPKDYPMVAPDYAEARRRLAHRIGLGRKAVADGVSEVVATVSETVGEVAAGVGEAAAGVVEAVTRPTRAARAKAAARAHLGGGD